MRIVDVPNELVNWRRSPAGAQGTNMGHQNREAMAHVGVHVERPVRAARWAECSDVALLVCTWL